MSATSAWAQLNATTVRAIADQLAHRTEPLSNFDLQHLGVPPTKARALVAEMAGVCGAGWKATTRAVLALREATDLPRPQLVWSGPHPNAAQPRLTTEAVHELFRRAKLEIWVLGYSFDDPALVAPLREACERGVSVRMVVDLKQERLHGRPRALTDAEVDVQLRSIQTALGLTASPIAWYFDARLLDPDETFLSMHAKVVAVDKRWLLITSANFTGRAQTRNVEVGVLHDDARLAEELTGFFHNAVAERQWRRWDESST